MGKGKYFKLFSVALFASTLFNSCSKPKAHNQFDLRGSWVVEFDTSFKNYTELYFGDSVYTLQDEAGGRHPKRRYFISKDTLFEEVYGKGIIPYCKILSLRQDTLWLKGLSEMNSLYQGYIIKFPKDEFGYFDLEWNEENKDSLNIMVENDWHRRMRKFYAVKYNDLHTYDSLIAAGFWDWSMKDAKKN
jgi:hypothetical protein